MQITINMTGSLEEIAAAINAISKQQEREKSLFDSISIQPAQVPVAQKPPRVHKYTNRRSVPIEIHMGSDDS